MAAAATPPSSLQSPVSVRYHGKYDQLGASAELWLYTQAAPSFFKGAQLANAANDIWRGDRGTFDSMWRQASSNSSQPRDTNHNSYAAEERATIATSPSEVEGKVASIRWVSVEPEQPPPASKGWFGSLLGSSHTPRCINVLEIGKPRNEATTSAATQDDGEEKIVLLHGYGAGTGFFFQNIDALASRPHSRLYALDWLGMGRSSRPTYHIPSHILKSGDDLQRVEAAEGFFLDSLEEWRKRAGVERMTLVGHSLGGYLSTAYAIRHPQRVNRLVLVSPVGVGAAPPEEGQPQQAPAFDPKNAAYVSKSAQGDVDADGASLHSVHSVEREVLDPQRNMVPENAAQEHEAAQKVQAGAQGVPTNSDGTTQPLTEEQLKSSGHRPPRFSSRTRAVFGWLWEQNFSPFGLLRTSSIFGPYLMSRYTQRRFGTLPEEELKALHAYCQGIFLARGSGEYCLAHMLKPGAWARVPLVHRLAGSGGAGIGALPSTLPVSLIYGEHDWMDADAGREFVKKLKTYCGNERGACYVVPHAGHHVYLDNPVSTNRLLGKILDGRADKVVSK